MLQRIALPIENVYVPVKRLKRLNSCHVLELAESILEKGQTTPIRVRADGNRFVLIEGMHRLEALKALGEKFAFGYLTRARLH